MQTFFYLILSTFQTLFDSCFDSSTFEKYSQINKTVDMGMSIGTGMVRVPNACTYTCIH